MPLRNGRSEGACRAPGLEWEMNMATNLSLEDLFRVAERMERRGAEFYRQAARDCPNEEGGKVLAHLAELEDEHEQVFSAIGQHATQQKKAVPLAPRAAAQCRVVADLVLGDLTNDLRQRFRGKHSTRDILREAIDFEKDTIVFLTQLCTMLERPADKRKVQQVLREELSHVMLLGSQLAGDRPRGGDSAFVHAIA
jgi:rubrerythrin